MHRVTGEDLDEAKELIDDLDEAQNFFKSLYDCAINPASTDFGFVAKIMDQIVGCFILSKDVNLDYYTSHFHV